MKHKCPVCGAYVKNVCSKCAVHRTFIDPEKYPEYYELKKMRLTNYLKNLKNLNAWNG